MLESPGAYAFGDGVVFEGVKKFPPVNHYYFAPDTEEWPSDVSDVKIGYGDQFAYLVQRFNLRNAYFTNVVKCGKSNKDSEKWESFKGNRKHDRIIAKNCYDQVLSQEIEAFKPDIIFSFGANAFWLFDHCNDLDIAHWQLNHPAKRMNLQENVLENESKVRRLFEQKDIL